MDLYKTPQFVSFSFPDAQMSKHRFYGLTDLGLSLMGPHLSQLHQTLGNY